MANGNAANNMQQLLSKLGIPSKDIKVYGSQIMITCWGEASARKFADAVSNFAKVRAVFQTVDENIGQDETAFKECHKVWRVAACINK